MAKQLSEFEYILTQEEKLGEYAGKWIAVVGNEIVAHGDSAKKVYDRAKAKHPNKVPFIMMVPSPTLIVL